MKPIIYAAFVVSLSGCATNNNNYDIAILNGRVMDEEEDQGRFVPVENPAVK